jgi:hypothetical protein
MKNLFILFLLSVSLWSCGGADPSDAKQCQDFLCGGTWAQNENGKPAFGRGNFNFNQNGTFTFHRVFNNDNVIQYNGTYVIDRYVPYESKPENASRIIVLNFGTKGEYTDAVGSIIEAELIPSLKMLKVSKVTYYRYPKE